MPSPWSTDLDRTLGGGSSKATGGRFRVVSVQPAGLGRARVRGGRAAGRREPGGLRAARLGLVGGPRRPGRVPGRALQARPAHRRRSDRRRRRPHRALPGLRRRGRGRRGGVHPAPPPSGGVRPRHLGWVCRDQPARGVGPHERRAVRGRHRRDHRHPRRVGLSERPHRRAAVAPLGGRRRPPRVRRRVRGRRRRRGGQGRPRRRRHGRAPRRPGRRPLRRRGRRLGAPRARPHGAGEREERGRHLGRRGADGADQRAAGLRHHRGAPRRGAGHRHRRPGGGHRRRSPGGHRRHDRRRRRRRAAEPAQPARPVLRGGGAGDRSSRRRPAAPSALRPPREAADRVGAGAPRRGRSARLPPPRCPRRWAAAASAATW